MHALISEFLFVKYNESKLKNNQCSDTSAVVCRIRHCNLCFYYLKKDVPMTDPSASLPAIQMLLSWTLLGVLLAWMLFFAFLAFQPQKVERRERELADLPTPSGAFPAMAPRTPFRRTSLPVERSLGAASVSASEAVGDVGTAPVA